jgi:hypothetical protein
MKLYLATFINLYLAAFIAGTAGPAQAKQPGADIRCFSDSAKQIQVEFRTYSDDGIGWVGGQVRYGQSQQFIPLVFNGSKTVKKIKDRPSEFEHTWLEVVDGAISGQYRLNSQGANVYGFAYTSLKTGKTTNLPVVSWVDESGKCVWK